MTTIMLYKKNHTDMSQWKEHWNMLAYKVLIKINPLIIEAALSDIIKNGCNIYFQTFHSVTPMYTFMQDIRSFALRPSGSCTDSTARLPQHMVRVHYAVQIWHISKRLSLVITAKVIHCKPLKPTTHRPTLTDNAHVSSTQYHCCYLVSAGTWD